MIYGPIDRLTDRQISVVSWSHNQRTQSIASQLSQKAAFRRLRLKESASIIEDKQVYCPKYKVFFVTCFFHDSMKILILIFCKPSYLIHECQDKIIMLTVLPSLIIVFSALRCSL